MDALLIAGIANEQNIRVTVTRDLLLIAGLAN